MPFEPRKLRVERYQVQASYHAAFQYWNAKSLLAERWAHGPYFGAWVEGPGDQLTLSPAVDPQQPNPPPLQATVGIRVSGLLAEQIDDRDRVAQVAQEWLDDVYTALRPRRTVQIRIWLFGLYPIRDPDRATERLRSRFYVQDQLRLVIPGRLQDDYHCAIDIAGWDESTMWSSVVGVVGPPHKGVYFSVPNTERDEAWWIGFNMGIVQTDDDGIAEPLERLEMLGRRLRADFDSIARTVLPEVVA